MYDIYFSASTKLLKLLSLVTQAVIFSLNMNCFPFATGSVCFSGSKKLPIGLTEHQLLLDRAKMSGNNIMLAFWLAAIIAMTSWKERYFLSDERSVQKIIIMTWIVFCYNSYSVQ